MFYKWANMRTFFAATPPVLTPYYDLIMWVLIIEAALTLIAGIIGVGIQLGILI